MMSTTGAVARTVIVLAVLFAMITGCDRHLRHAHDGGDHLRQFLRVGVRDVEHPHHHVVVLLPLVGAIVDDDDGLAG